MIKKLNKHMKTKLLLIAIFSLITFTSIAQNNKTTSSTSATTNFELKTSSIEKLTTFNWNTLKEMFKENEDDQEITIAFVYENTTKIDNFEMKLSGKTSDLDKMTNRFKKSFQKLEEFDNKN